MSTVEQIEAAIEQLPREDFFRIHEWMRERLNDEWDRRLSRMPNRVGSIAWLKLR